MRKLAVCGGLLVAASLWAAPARAQIGATSGGVRPGANLSDAELCPSAVASAERSAALPLRLLSAIAVVESGRSVGGRVVPWPWTINVGGVGRYFASKAEAVAAVQSLQASGVRSIDVGCAQVNLMHHPAAFASVEDAFDPGLNAGYAARFLTALYRGSRSWPLAAAAYHSQTRDLAVNYLRRVTAAWPGAAANGADEAVLLLSTPSTRSPLPAAGSLGAAAQVNRIDPRGVYTPEFARELALDAAFRARRDAAMRDGGLPGEVRRLAARGRRRTLAEQSDRGSAWPQGAARHARS